MSQMNAVPVLSAGGRRPPLDAYFHYTRRGGTLGGEIAAGLFTGILSVCGIFLNMQLVAKLQISGGYAASNAAQAWSTTSLAVSPAAMETVTSMPWAEERRV